MIKHQKLKSKKNKRQLASESTAASDGYSPYDTDMWPVIDIENMEGAVDDARRLGKHLFLWDKSGQVAAFFSEFGIHNEFITDMVSVALASAKEVNGVLNDSL